jgi:hypothetical protein
MNSDLYIDQVYRLAKMGVVNDLYNFYNTNKSIKELYTQVSSGVISRNIKNKNYELFYDACKTNTKFAYNIVKLFIEKAHPNILGIGMKLAGFYNCKMSFDLLYKNVKPVSNKAFEELQELLAHEEYNTAEALLKKSIGSWNHPLLKIWSLWRACGYREESYNLLYKYDIDKNAFDMDGIVKSIESTDSVYEDSYEITFLEIYIKDFIGSDIDYIEGASNFSQILQNINGPWKSLFRHGFKGSVHFGNLSKFIDYYDRFPKVFSEVYKNKHQLGILEDVSALELDKLFPDDAYEYSDKRNPYNYFIETAWHVPDVGADDPGTNTDIILYKLFRDQKIYILSESETTQKEVQFIVTYTLNYLDII